MSVYLFSSGGYRSSFSLHDKNSPNYVKFLCLRCVFVCLPDPGHSEIRWKLGNFHHLRSVGELFKDPES